MSVVQLHCPLCQGAFQVDDSMARQNVSCPFCQDVVTIPAFAPASAPAGFSPGLDPQMFPPGLAPAKNVYAPPLSFEPPPPSFAPDPVFTPAPKFSKTPTIGPPAGHDVPPLGAMPPGAMVGAPSQLGCPVCSGQFQVSPDMAGQTLGCPHCNSAVTIPSLWNGGRETPRMPDPIFPAHDGSHLLPPAAATEAANEAPLQQFYPPGFGPGERVSGPTPAPTSGMAAMYPPRLEPAATAVAPLSQTKKSEPALSSFYPPGFAKVESKPTAPVAPKREARAHADETPLANDLLPPGVQTQTPSPASVEKVTPPQPRSKSGGGPPPTISRRPGPGVESLLPPGAPGTIEALLPPGRGANPAESLLPPGSATSSGVDSLLPPGVAPSQAESFLPPGVTPSFAPAPVQQVALPTPQPALPQRKAKKARRRPGEPSVLIPTKEGGYVEVQEPVKTIMSGNEEIELKRLTPEEKAKRRMIRNLVVGGFCLLVVAVTMIVLVYTRG